KEQDGNMETEPAVASYSRWWRSEGAAQIEQIATPLSLPGLTRQSILPRKDFLRRRWMRGSGPRMTSGRQGRPGTTSRTIPFVPAAHFCARGLDLLLHSPRTRGGRSAEKRSGARRNTRAACHDAACQAPSEAPCVP